MTVNGCQGLVAPLRTGSILRIPPGEQRRSEGRPEFDQGPLTCRKAVSTRSNSGEMALL